MQTLEASVSLLFFISVCTFLFASFDSVYFVNDSLYRMQLAEDVWRVLYLRDAFAELDNNFNTELKGDVDKIGEETGLCIFIQGIRISNCRGGIHEHDMIVSISKTVVYDSKPTEVTVSIGL